MNRKGFTLIELLIVVVIIGILAAIAIPRFGETRQRAYVSAMQSDLNQLRTAMEMYYQDNEFTYAGATVEGLITLSPGVGVETEVAGDQTSWSAALNHDAYPNATCDYDSAVGSIACALPE
jgi:type IV pilus assembly protein PilA